jgi:hypothetical protein
VNTYSFGPNKQAHITSSGTEFCNWIIDIVQKYMVLNLTLTYLKIALMYRKGFFFKFLGEISKQEV